MIRFIDTTFSYPNSDPIFSGLDLQINKEEITVLTGINGSGKTTLCRMIMGLIQNYSGSLKINLTERSTLTTEKIAEQIVFLKQEPAANVVSAIPREDLDIWLHKFKKKSLGDYERTSSALEYFDLADQIEQPVWELSNGQLKRVGLSALLLNQDKYWLLDEPTSGLDNRLIEKLIELIKMQKDRNQGMLIITHRYSTFSDVADRILKIENKKVNNIL